MNKNDKFLIRIGFVEYSMTEEQVKDFLNNLDTAEETKNLSNFKKDFIRSCVNKSLELKIQSKM